VSATDQRRKASPNTHDYLDKSIKRVSVTYVAFVHVHPNLRTVRCIGADLCLCRSPRPSEIWHTAERVRGNGRVRGGKGRVGGHQAMVG
jgi:hypothetical protein